MTRQQFGIKLGNTEVFYFRALANQSISASGTIAMVIDLGVGGARTLSAVYSSLGIAFITVYPCDMFGNPLTAGTNWGSSNSTGYLTGNLVIAELAGCRYIKLYMTDKSALANTCNFIDLSWTRC